MFDQLNQLQVTRETTREYPFRGIRLGPEGTPTVVVRVANEDNGSFENAFKAAFRASKGKELTRAENRAVMAKLFARHCVAGWSGFYDKDAKGNVALVDFDSLKCEEFLLKLAVVASDMFDAFAGFIMSPSNFRDAPPLDGDELGKT